MRFTFLRYDVDASLRSLHSFNHFKIHHREGSIHLVWGRLSVHVEDWTLEIHPTCAQCGSASIGEVSAGDDGWTVCQSCQSIEQGYTYVNLREYENAHSI